MRVLFSFYAWTVALFWEKSHVSAGDHFMIWRDVNKPGFDRLAVSDEDAFNCFSIEFSPVGIRGMDVRRGTKCS